MWSQNLLRLSQRRTRSRPARPRCSILNTPIRRHRQLSISKSPRALRARLSNRSCAMTRMWRCTARAHCNACRTARFARSSTACTHSKSKSVASIRTKTSATCSKIWPTARLIRLHMYMATTIFDQTDAGTGLVVSVRPPRESIDKSKDRRYKRKNKQVQQRLAGLEMDAN